jgi:hypothetical protein
VLVAENQSTVTILVVETNVPRAGRSVIGTEAGDAEPDGRLAPGGI